MSVAICWQTVVGYRFTVRVTQERFILLARSSVCPCDRLLLVVPNWKRFESKGVTLTVRFHSGLSRKGLEMAMQNYTFAKRQRDLAKKKKQEEKRQRKLDAQPPIPSPPLESPTEIAP